MCAVLLQQLALPVLPQLFGHSPACRTIIARTQRLALLWHPLLQDGLVLVVMELMPGGSLRAALQNPAKRQALRWEAG